MTLTTATPTATRQNIPRCTNCHSYMPTLISTNAVRFCDEECCHEWSSKMIGAIDPREAFEILNRLRIYLKAKLAGVGDEVAFVSMCMTAMHMFKELPLEKLCPQTLAIQAVEDKVDTDILFP